jgi:hypothetical protein
MRWGQGDERALEELLPIVYEELRRLARKHVRSYTDRVSFQPTALLHEAYLKLPGLHDPEFENRAEAWRSYSCNSERSEESLWPEGLPALQILMTIVIPPLGQAQGSGFQKDVLVSSNRHAELRRIIYSTS